MLFDQNELLKQEISAIKRSTEIQLHQNSKFNYYIDKQLKHLVVTQQFNFQHIALILKNVFKYDQIQFTQKNCRQRWYQLHRDRYRQDQLKQQTKQNKRIQAIIGFTNPYSLYSVQQHVQQLQKNQKSNEEKIYQLPNIPINGYNIFKDSIRKIDNMEQYLKKENAMKEALKRAQDQSQIINQKPMFFMPSYQSDNFELKGQQLTSEIAQKLMSNKIEMQRFQRQFEIRQQMVEKKYESKIKKQVIEQKQNNKYQIQQNWDQYQSD